MMRGFHVNSTSPSVILAGRYKSDNQYYIEDFEILTTILSALKWRQYNGSIKMYTDNLGKAYYDELGISDIWDEGINVDVLENIKLNINTDVFWAFGKILALSQETSPCVIFDTDLIVWNNISHLINAELMAFHREPLELVDTYVPQEKLKVPPDYVWEEWDWTANPCNAALLYFGSNKIKDYFTDRALLFMHNNPAKKEEKPTHMVFAEQRLLVMCAKKIGVEIRYFLDEIFAKNLDYGKGNNLFTHIWGYKSVLKEKKLDRKLFCLRCINRILKDFPEYEEKLHNIPTIKKYMASLSNS